MSFPFLSLRNALTLGEFFSFVVEDILCGEPVLLLFFCCITGISRFLFILSTFEGRIELPEFTLDDLFVDFVLSFIDLYIYSIIV